MINPSTGELVTEFGPMASAEIILLDEINRIPLKSQSAFLEGLQDRTVTVGKVTYELPAFSFAIARNPPHDRRRLRRGGAADPRADGRARGGD